MDTLQIGDRRELDGLLEIFPVSVHEPYFASYIASRLKAPFEDAALVHKSDALAFLSKVSVFEKPQSA